MLALGRAKKESTAIITTITTTTKWLTRSNNRICCAASRRLLLSIITERGYEHITFSLFALKTENHICWCELATIYIFLYFRVYLHPHGWAPAYTVYYTIQHCTNDAVRVCMRMHSHLPSLSLRCIIKLAKEKHSAEGLLVFFFLFLLLFKNVFSLAEMISFQKRQNEFRFKVLRLRAYIRTNKRHKI